MSLQQVSARLAEIVDQTLGDPPSVHDVEALVVMAADARAVLTRAGVTLDTFDSHDAGLKWVIFCDALAGRSMYDIAESHLNRTGEEGIIPPAPEPEEAVVRPRQPVRSKEATARLMVRHAPPEQRGPVYGPDGTKLGVIRRQIVDNVSDRIAYGLLSVPGPPGERFAVPWSKFTYDKELLRYRTDITIDRVRRAPKFSGSSEFYKSDRIAEQQLHEYYEARPYWIE